jgi:fibronectin type 3 domain-containing protein
VNVSGAGFTVSGVTAGETLTPNQSVTVTVTFAPTTAGAVTGSVSIVSNATNSPSTVNLSGTGVAAVQHTVSLNWNASTSQVVGYNVYRGTTSSGPYSTKVASSVASTDYTDSTVASGTTYYYVVTAVDSNNNESSYSNQATAVIP